MTQRQQRQFLFAHQDTFARRHLGSSDADVQAMLEQVGYDSMEAFMAATLPTEIRRETPLQLPEPLSETEALAELKSIISENQLFRSFLGMGYHNCLTPAVIQRNILENPGWYTQYTPYQAEISQGRLEALANFQTMVVDLTGLPLAGASLLDEATAAAEAMAMAFAVKRRKKHGFFVANHCHPQTLALLQTRAEPMGIELHIGDPATFDFASVELFGGLVQYPTTDGALLDPTATIEALHAQDALAVVGAELLMLTLLKSPGELGADIAYGSTQRFGVPLGFGGPHAAYLSCRDAYKRQMPGRLIGLSQDTHGHHAYRLALQTREQHIRRDRATSNICTSQVLLAIMASMYAVYHGPQGLKNIATRVHLQTRVLAAGLDKLGFGLRYKQYFDTIRVEVGEKKDAILQAAHNRKINLRSFEDDSLGVALDETVGYHDLEDLLLSFAVADELAFDLGGLADAVAVDYPEALTRTSEYLGHPNFHRYHTEHEILRYIHRLQGRDLSLTHSMIPLGSCTMKLNATSEMLPVTWAEFGNVHPFAPAEQSRGYQKMFAQLEAWLADITGFAATSLQPNAGSQGEYTGLLTIRAYHHHNGDTHRDICLIPSSAHGTNPASAVMAGFKVVGVGCMDNGDIDVEDLRTKAEKYKETLGALMITYPSTHGVFEEHIREVCDIIHDNGGQVYLDGANMNAQVGYSGPGLYGADVCHLNLHKTFCIPHGGGGPGMGPICVASQLAPFLPGHPLREDVGGAHAIGPVSAAPWGSPSILPISWMYIRMMGAEGLTKATEMAVLNANYMASRLKEDYDILFTGPNGLVAHEFVLDLRPFKKTSGVEVVDVAKRLMDFGFHAPTMSWPVPGTLMVEPTESESRVELERFVQSMRIIRDEIRVVESGEWPQDNNPLKNSPHTSGVMTATEWNHPYTREKAAYPVEWVRDGKFWPHVGRINDAYGDRHLFCTCAPVEEYTGD